MLIAFSGGKIIVTAHEVVVRLSGEHRVTLQSHVDELQLIGNGANVLLANCGACKWSLKLDNELQLIQLADAIGIATN
jgi:hypothetical protein